MLHFGEIVDIQLCQYLVGCRRPESLPNKETDGKPDFHTSFMVLIPHKLYWFVCQKFVYVEVVVLGLKYDIP